MIPKNEFEILISEELTPVLKEFGFKKKNLNYYRNTGEVFQTFNIQRSQFNDKHSLKFTGNIGLTEPISYSKLRKLPGPPNQINYDESQFTLRSGILTDNMDYWYKITDWDDITAVRLKFKNDIQTLKNFMDAYSTRASLLGITNSLPEHALLINPLDQYALLKVTGKESEAKALFKRNYNELKEPSLFGKILKWIKSIVSDREISLSLIREQRKRYEEVAGIFGEIIT